MKSNSIILPFSAPPLNVNYCSSGSKSKEKNLRNRQNSITDTHKTPSAKIQYKISNHQ